MAEGKTKMIDSIDDLEFDQHNANKGTALGQTMVDQSIERYGAGRSIVIDKHGVVIGGNKTLKSARDAGLDIKVIRTTGESLIVHQREDLDLNDGDDARMLAYIDNRSSETGLDWDADVILDDIAAGLELGEVFDDKALADIGVELPDDDTPEPEAQIDKADELQEKWQVKDGDVWEIGAHRLMCGDNSDKPNLFDLFDGKYCDVVFTSPPYGQQRDYGDASDVSDWDKMMRGAFENIPCTDKTQVLVNLGLICKNGDVVTYWDDWVVFMRGVYERLRGWYVWDKGTSMPGASQGRMSTEHEWIFHFSKAPVDPKKLDKCKREGGSIGSIRSKDGSMTKISTKINSHKIRGSVAHVVAQMAGVDGHPAQFSVELPTFYIESWDGLIYDPFMGSGTTMVACEQLNRKCYGMEIEPKYCAVILERMSDMGLTPELTSNARETKD